MYLCTQKQLELVQKVMRIVNDTILDVMDKVIEMVEPKTQIELSHKIDLSTGKLVPNPNYKPIKEKNYDKQDFLHFSMFVLISLHWMSR